MSNRKYFDPAQAESDHKDLVISQLKAELYELKSNERDYNQLNVQLNNLQHKYTLLQEDKLRSERDRRQKMENDQRAVLNFKDEFDTLKAEQRNQNIDLQELRADNQALREMADYRSQELSKFTGELNQLEIDNARSQEENNSNQIGLRQLQDDKKQLIDESESCAVEADTLIHKNRNLEKTVAELKLENQKLDQNLMDLESFNDKLNLLLKEKNEINADEEQKQRENERKLQILNQERLEVEKLNEKAMGEARAIQDEYQQELTMGKEFAQNLTTIETTIRSKELQIDDFRNNFEVQKQKHFNLVEENRNTNDQIDLVLKQIEELNYKNQELCRQIEIFNEQDQKVRLLLDRREQSNELVGNIDSKLKNSMAGIMHLTRR